MFVGTFCSALCADSITQLCQQHPAAAKDVQQALQNEASNLQTDFQRRLADLQQETLKLGASQFSRYLTIAVQLHHLPCTPF